MKTKINMTELTKLVNISRQSVYKALQSGRISRNNDKTFNIDEVLRAFPQSEYEYSLQKNDNHFAKNDNGLHSILSTNDNTINIQNDLISQLKKENERLEKEKQEIWEMYKQEREKNNLFLPKPKKKWFFR